MNRINSLVQNVASITPNAALAFIFRSSLFGALYVLAALACAFASLGSAKAGPINLGPPISPILDLAGQTAPSPCGTACPVTTTFMQYSVNFSAAFTTTDLTFVFRNDPNYTALDDVSVTDLTHPMGELIMNGGFESGLTHWRYDNVYGASAGGRVLNGCGGISNHGGLSEYCDGAVQAYDAIDQSIHTTIGDVYHVSFWTAAHGNDALYQQLSTNGNVTGTGGNGIDTLVYESLGLPAASNSPEPGSMFMIATGLIGLGIRRRLWGVAVKYGIGLCPGAISPKGERTASSPAQMTSMSSGSSTS